MDLGTPSTSRYTFIVEDIQVANEPRRRASVKTPTIECTSNEIKICVGRAAGTPSGNVETQRRQDIRLSSTGTSVSSTRTTGARSSDSSISRVLQESRLRLQSLFRSFSASSGPICRICHEGDNKESLLSPCYCSGTMGLVHVTCMERWLSCSNSDVCELCHYKFKTKKTPKSFMDWLKDSTGSIRHQRSLVGDGVCFALLTPLAVVGAFLCIEGAHQQVLEGNRMEAGCLVALSAVLALVYFLWTGLTCRYYYRQWKRWQLTNHNIHMIYTETDVTSNVPGSSTTNPTPYDGQQEVVFEPRPLFLTDSDIEPITPVEA